MEISNVYCIHYITNWNNIVQNFTYHKLINHKKCECVYFTGFDEKQFTIVEYRYNNKMYLYSNIDDFINSNSVISEISKQFNIHNGISNCLLSKNDKNKPINCPIYMTKIIKQFTGPLNNKTTLRECILYAICKTNYIKESEIACIKIQHIGIMMSNDTTIDIIHISQCLCCHHIIEHQNLLELLTENFQV